MMMMMMITFDHTLRLFNCS